MNNLINTIVLLIIKLELISKIKLEIHFYFQKIIQKSQSELQNALKEVPYIIQKYLLKASIL